MKNPFLTMAFMSLILGALLLSGCAVEVIDFEDLVEGEIVSEVYGHRGTGPIFVEGTNPSFAPGTNAAVIFDSSCAPGGVPADCSGNDTDLGTPNQNFGGPGVGSGGSEGSSFENHFSGPVSNPRDVFQSRSR